MIELTVKVKNSESKLSKNFLLYDEDIVLNTSDAKLKAYVDQTVKDFLECGKPETVETTLKMIW